MQKTVTIHLMNPFWLMSPREHHMSMLRNELWSNGWRDGVEIKLEQFGPVLVYTFEEVKSDPESNSTQFSTAQAS